MINLTENEKSLMQRLLKNAAQFSSPTFWAKSCCKSKENVGALSSMIKKGVIAPSKCGDERYYDFTDAGIALAKELGYLEPLKGIADWMYCE